MIEARELQHFYGGVAAVQGISFSIPEGQICGILGPNGAGKTTTLRKLTGFLPSNPGQVTVAGHDLVREPLRARRQIGYLPENVALYTEMRVEEFLRYRARLQGLPRGDVRRALDAAIDGCLLGDVRHQVIGTLSKGYRQRVGLAAAILHEPAVLVLDEPTVGLDPNQIVAIRELIRELGQRHTLLLSTHILPEVEQLCDRVLIIDRGHLVAEGTPGELRDLAHQDAATLRVLLKGNPEDAAETLGQLDGVRRVESSSEDGGEGLGEQSGGGGATRFVVEHTATGDLREQVFHAAVEHGWVLLEMAERKASLEETFVRLTAHAGDAAEPGTPEESTTQVPANAARILPESNTPTSNSPTEEDAR